jgi:hypothetical protein
MKKSIFIAVLGMAAVAAYGQGKIDFSNYGGTSSPTVNYPSNVNGGVTVGSSFYAELYYYVGATALDIPTSTSQMTALTTDKPLFGSSLGGSYTGADGTPGSGWFEGGIVQIPGVTSANNLFTSFAIYVSNDPALAGFTSIFQYPTSASASAGATSMAAAFGSGGGTLLTLLPVPEPTTLALAGLGGLASLVAFRRKQA